MQYEELHRCYGTHVSQRIRRELAESEFNALCLETLPAWLEARAEAAHAEYRYLLNNPMEASTNGTFTTGEACRRWREAEDLAYLVAVAIDVSANARAL